MDRPPVGEDDDGTRLYVRRYLLRDEFSLDFVGYENRSERSFRYRLGGFYGRETVFRGTGAARTPGPQGHGHGDAAVAKVKGLRASLAAVSDNGYAGALERGRRDVVVVVNFEGGIHSGIGPFALLFFPDEDPAAVFAEFDAVHAT